MSHVTQSINALRLSEDQSSKTVNPYVQIKTRTDLATDIYVAADASHLCVSMLAHAPIDAGENVPIAIRVVNSGMKLLIYSVIPSEMLTAEDICHAHGEVCNPGYSRYCSIKRMVDRHRSSLQELRRGVFAHVTEIDLPRACEPTPALNSYAPLMSTEDMIYHFLLELAFVDQSVPSINNGDLHFAKYPASVEREMQERLTAVPVAQNFATAEVLPATALPPIAETTPSDAASAAGTHQSNHQINHDDMDVTYFDNGHSQADSVATQTTNGTRRSRRCRHSSGQPARLGAEALSRSTIQTRQPTGNVARPDAIQTDGSAFVLKFSKIT